MKADKAERERRRQVWLAALEADKKMMAPRIRQLSAELQESSIPYAPPIKRTPASAHLEYYLRTGKKFMDLPEAFYLLLDCSTCKLMITNPKNRCQKCRKKKTPGKVSRQLLKGLIINQ